MNPTIANSYVVPDARQSVSETIEARLTRLRQKLEVLLRRAFGDDEATIVNSLRGF